MIRPVPTNGRIFWISAADAQSKPSPARASKRRRCWLSLHFTAAGGPDN
jgi:hypothetical protein